jgi:MtN3 and saliva related transmembrane protein
VIVLATAAAVFGIIMGAAPLLQLLRMLRLRSSRDISMSFFALAAVGQLIWVIYGIALHNAAVVVSNGCGMLANTGVLITAMALRKRRIALQPEVEPVLLGDPQ